MTQWWITNFAYKGAHVQSMEPLGMAENNYSLKL